jgi:uncharacterized protein
MSPRLISPHPYTNQDTLALARGPIVYCVEDVDNTWVTDHFKGVLLDPACAVEEKPVTDAITGDKYVALMVKRGAKILQPERIRAEPGVDVGPLDGVVRADDGVVDELHFIPYYFRASRGGRGQARVGLKRWHR